ncbi:hypothetical protein K2173_018455 [Erythroxylum novogranatense]|uniref:Uncharacterized protein n=1 Tax=Erythroxylum novogranatense TaxID=1862640 RepID=A0AAV8UAR1_9ROSI|nr:hypothetical protein K2173_018455 [Erythroxylum novogranatense]
MASKEAKMKILSAQRIKRAQFLKWGKRIASSEAEETVRKLSSGCRRGSNVLRLIVWKLRRQWNKQTSGWQRTSTSHYSYDLYSYSMNFDDGLRQDRFSS